MALFDSFVAFVNAEIIKRVSTNDGPTSWVLDRILVATGVGLGTTTKTLTQLGLVSQAQLDALETTLATKADKTIRALAGTGLSGGGTLASDFTYNLANIGIGAGTVGSASQSLNVTINAQGQVTNYSVQSIQIIQSQVTGLSTSLAGKQPVDSTLTSFATYDTNGILVQTATDTFVGRSFTDSANIAWTNPSGIAGNFSANLTTTGVTATTYGSASNVPVQVVDVYGRITLVTNTPILITESQVTNLVTDLGLKAPLASPALTGTPTTPTATSGTNTTQIASTAFVTTAVSGLNEFVDNVFRIKDDGDATKKIAFQASGLTTGNTRTITAQDFDYTNGSICPYVASTIFQTGSIIAQQNALWSKIATGSSGASFNGALWTPLTEINVISSNQSVGAGWISNIIGTNIGTSTVRGTSNTIFSSAATFTVGAVSILGGATNTFGATSVQSAGFYATIVGGASNKIGDTTAAVDYCTIAGGDSNRIRAAYTFIGNGGNNHIDSGTYSSIVGGFTNTINSQYGIIGGGANNNVSSTATYQSIFSGNTNTISSSGTNGFIGNGESCTISGSANFGTIVNGKTCVASGLHSFVGVGLTNTASAVYSFVGNGTSNTASASGGSSTVINGTSNTASHTQSIVLNGNNNIASKPNSTVINGATNTANGGMSVVLTGNNVTTTMGGGVVQGPYQGGYSGTAPNKQSAILIGLSSAGTFSVTAAGSGGGVTTAGDTKEVNATVPNGMTNTKGCGVHEVLVASKTQGATYRAFTAKYIVACSYDGTTYTIDGITTVHTSSRNATTFTVAFAIVSGVLTITGTCDGDATYITCHVESVYS